VDRVTENGVRINAMGASGSCAPVAHPVSRADRQTHRTYDALVHATPDAGHRWVVQHHVGPAEQLHHLELAPRRGVHVLEPVRPALVLGSTQPADTADPTALRAAGVELARRRSGGGAVLLVPGEHVWIDVVLPAGDPLWLDDVEASAWWLGEAWAAALRSAAPAVGVPTVHRSGVTDRELGRWVCFAAAGPGEVLVSGRKLVGISQRRSRHLARFQCVVHRHLRPTATTSLLADVHGRPDRPRLDDALRDGACDLASLGVDPGWGVVEDLLAQLP
jgi:lipoate-protein ligase A